MTSASPWKLIQPESNVWPVAVAGRVDILDSSSESISSQTIQFWASTTKLVTSVDLFHAA